MSDIQVGDSPNQQEFDSAGNSPNQHELDGVGGSPTKEDLLSLCRESFAAFCCFIEPDFQVADHVKRIINRLVRAERIPARDIINMPPRSSKSLTVSMLYPCWYLGRNPHKKVIGASYGMELTEMIGRYIRDVMLSDKFKAIFPDCDVDAPSASVTRINTKNGGAYVGTTVGGVITGLTADLLIVDDPIKGFKEANSRHIRDNTINWYKTQSFTRLMPTASVIIVMQRWHEDDLAGYLLREHSDVYSHVNIKAIENGKSYWPGMWSIERLEEVKKMMGDFLFQALYMQKPRPSESALFNIDKITRLNTTTPDGVRIVNQVRYWDRAGTDKIGGDWTAGVKLGIDQDRNIYILDVRRFKKNSYETQRIIQQMASLDGTKCKIGIEQDPGQSGKFEAEYLSKQLFGFNFKIIRPTGDKTLRATPVSSIMSSGFIYMVKAGWNEEFLLELEEFPHGRHDDQVDALSGAFSMLNESNYNFAALCRW